MADFKPIETQEELDRIVNSRVYRAEKAIKEQFADYEQIKETASKADETIANLQAELEKKQSTIDGNKAIVDELNSKIASYELSQVKVKIALEKGIPYQMAERLKGNDEKEITADADAMVGLIGSTRKAPPLHNNEQGKKSSDPMKDGISTMLQNLQNGD